MLQAALRQKIQHSRWDQRCLWEETLSIKRTRRAAAQHQPRHEAKRSDRKPCFHSQNPEKRSRADRNDDIVFSLTRPGGPLARVAASLSQLTYGRPPGGPYPCPVTRPPLPPGHGLVQVPVPPRSATPWSRTQVAGTFLWGLGTPLQLASFPSTHCLTVADRDPEPGPPLPALSCIFVS